MARNPSPQSKKPKAGGLPAAARRLLKRLAHGDPVKAVEASAAGALVSAGLASVNEILAPETWIPLTWLASPAWTSFAPTRSSR